MTPLRFNIEDAQKASDAWNFNCGPGALCAVLGMTPDEIRPHLLDFEQKGYTNPTLMLGVLSGLKVEFGLTYRGNEPRESTHDFPDFGLVRVQWSGPWTKPSVPMRVRYRHTHWIAISGSNDIRQVFDINAICVGGWISWNEWATHLVPWLLKECEPKADGGWWPTHIIKLQESMR